MRISVVPTDGISMGLRNVLDEVKYYSSLKECFHGIAKSYGINPHYLSMRYYGYDKRIGWDAYLISRSDPDVYEQYNTTQAVGLLRFEEE